ncbi:4-hydroxythreonine-4-phosphate dehydrogenase [Auraticoccus sp. F435]|uniref:4-hydroxythreonine-4-phosphate dehydrogenase n=1 Tax=Auraticoccus cholistanensis TaxID=2656650 RepID=A0A6A9UYQ1_9ACTN|nr:four-carbon acid sugar kinase family protein [Auraticoccus cholistanensis]MVA77085.1 4-hydroxythreonine-4-phosphate dehydrogenase [Auraticoccus cholistanensis]
MPDRGTSAGRPLGVLADDLSGAVECAAVLGAGTPVLLSPEPLLDHGVPAGPVVVDADARLRSGAAAAGALEGAARALAGHTLFVKIDSLLRGPVAAAVSVAARRGTVVLCPALPAHGRSVRGGVLHLDGVPLHRTTAWHLEPVPAPDRVARLLPPGLTGAVVGRDRQRAGGLHQLLADPPAPVLVCDAEGPDDLARLGAAVRAHPGTVAVGSSGLLAAVAGATPARGHRTTPPGRRLVVVGSASAEAAEQTRRLLARHHVRLLPAPLHPDDGLDTAAFSASLTAALAGGDVVVTLPLPDRAARVEPARLAAQLGAAVVRAVEEQPVDLVLIGGATARGVLAAAGVERLEVVAQIHPGAVASLDPTGRLLVTRPGSHGSPDSLTQVLDWLEGPA